MTKKGQIIYSYDFDNIEYGEILEHYSYDDNKELESRKEIIDRIANCNFSNPRENQDIINSIVLWKINRRIERNDELIKDIYLLSQTINGYKDIKFKDIKAHEEKIKKVFEGLLKTTGISVAMASTILNMFMPNAFPIIDKRAYRVIYCEEMSTNINPEGYLKYVEKVYDFYDKRCQKIINFSDIDKVLYQIDIENGNTVK